MKPVIFLGPSLAHSDACRILAADYRPPAACGDVYRATQKGARQIALIDGYFDGQASVWHKEILWALSQGVQVHGGASMGALRAAELADFGMVGIGRIYQDYRHEILSDDDEVAVLHGPPELDYRPLSEALVNIRASLQRACRQGVLSDFESAQLLELGKQLYYRERHWDRLLEAAKALIEPMRLDAFRTWLRSNRVDQKRHDACLLLRYLRRFAGCPTRQPEINFVFEATQSWQRLVMVQEAKAREDLTEMDGLVLDELRLAGNYPTIRRQAALWYQMQSPEPVRFDPVERKALLKKRFQRWRQTLGLHTRAELEQYLTKIQKSLADIERALASELDSLLLQRQLGAALHKAMIDVLIASGDYGRLFKRASTKQQRLTVDRRPTPPTAVLLEWFAQHYAEDGDRGDPESYALELGLTGDELVQLAEREYRFAQRKEN